MIHPWHDLEPGSNVPDLMTVVVEIPRGSRNKYELNKETGLFKLDRVLYSAVHYPGDYGFFPRTYALDDDPLDALVMVTVPTFPGCAHRRAARSASSGCATRTRWTRRCSASRANDPLYDDYDDIGGRPGALPARGGALLLDLQGPGGRAGAADGVGGREVRPRRDQRRRSRATPCASAASEMETLSFESPREGLEL